MRARYAEPSVWKCGRCGAKDCYASKTMCYKCGAQRGAKAAGGVRSAYPWNSPNAPVASGTKEAPEPIEVQALRERLEMAKKWWPEVASPIEAQIEEAKQEKLQQLPLYIKIVRADRDIHRPAPQA